MYRHTLTWCCRSCLQKVFCSFQYTSSQFKTLSVSGTLKEQEGEKKDKGVNVDRFSGKNRNLQVKQKF